MTPRTSESAGDAPKVIASDGASKASSPMNPNLSANLHADYEALQNDMQQAKDLAADFQQQLAGKSNEFAQLKQLFEKTAADLAHLQSGIVELRAERHRLANESMRATAFQQKLLQVTAERDRLRVDVEHMRKALNQSSGEVTAAVRDRDAQIAVLVIELVTLKEALETARRELAASQTEKRPPIVPPPVETEPGRGKVEPAPAQKEEKIDLVDEFVDITFES